MFVADFHIHSKFSRACSRNLDLTNIEIWCQLKGIDLVATADFTHPEWFSELREKLEECDRGIYKLRKKFCGKNAEIFVPEKCRRDVRFICSTEISLIYKKNGKVRKIHLIILAPNLEIVAKINLKLTKIGNLNSDGRPILGLDSEKFVKILLDISPEIQIIPAHIWTPHFAIFGSKSGFDSVEECFGKMSDHICALETGLSSDPRMNWQISRNDKYALISNSDAHSLQKLGREATIFKIKKINYPAILHALRHDHQKIFGTIEFFPEEGKYFADGLRAENLCLMPDETKKNNFISPQTGKKITVGVLHRISNLADKKFGRQPKNAAKIFYAIPLVEILSEILGVGPNSKKVQQKYFELLEKLGTEFSILKNLPLEKIAAVDQILARAIAKIRAGKIILQPGFDGEFGKIQIFEKNEILSKN